VSAPAAAAGPARLRAVWVKRAKLGPRDPGDHATRVGGAGRVGNADQGRRRQVTVIAAEGWRDALSAVGPGVELDPSSRRANLLVSGVELAGSRGRVLRVGGCRLRVLGETRPCERMERALPGLKAALEPKWRGGVFGEVLDDGAIAVGDPVGWEDR
jgi:MOSC domain-containing protein YiiM